MVLRDEIGKKRNEFLKICREHHVRYLYAFGSSIAGNFEEQKSDIDLLVEIDLHDPIEKGSSLIALWDKFEIFFNRKVDLLTEQSITNPYLKKNIEASKILVYDRKNQEILI